MTGSGAPPNLTAGEAILQAATGINLTTNVSELWAYNTTSGDIVITNSGGALALDDLTSSGFAVKNAASPAVGNINITNIGNELDVNSTVKATGDVSLTGGNNLFINAGTISAGEPTITLNGGAGSVTQFGGTIGTGIEDLVATASTGITLGNTDVTRLQATNSTSGDILVNDTNTVGGNLTLADITSLGYAVQNSGGNVTITENTADLNANDSVSANGNVNLTGNNNLNLAGNINANGNTITLVANNDAVTQTAGQVGTTGNDNLVVSAVTGITLDNTDVAALQATNTTSGNINVDDTNSNSGNLALNDITGLGYSVKNFNGNVVITEETNDLNVNAAIMANGGGNILLITDGSGNLNVNADVAATGNNTLLSSNDLNINSGTVSAGNGHLIDLTADLQANGSGAITQTGGQVGSGVENLYTSSATGTTLNNADVVALQADNGLNGGSGDINITNNSTGLSLDDLGAGSGSYAIDNEVGNVIVTQTNGNLTVNALVTSAGNQITLTSNNGSITGGGQVGVGSDSLVLSAATGINLTNTDVANLQATNSTSGDIDVTDNSGNSFTLADITSLGYAVQNSGGSVHVTETNGDMNVNAHVSASTGNTVNLTALNNMNINNGTIGAANGSIFLTADSGSTNSGGIDQSGGVVGTGSENLILNSGSGINLNDTDVAALQATNNFSGDVSINDFSGNLTLKDITGAGYAIQNTPGNIFVTENNGSLTVHDSLTAANGDTIGLQALTNLAITGGTMSAANGKIELDADKNDLGNGAITQTGGQVGTGTEELAAHGATGVTITNADAAVLQSENTTSGDINITNGPADVAVNDFLGLGFGIQNLAGNVTVNETGNTAVNAGVSATSNSNVTLNSTGNITINNGSITAPNGTITLDADSANSGSGSITQPGSGIVGSGSENLVTHSGAGTSLGNTDVLTYQGTNTTSGNISVNNNGSGFALNDTTGLGWAVKNAGGNITINQNNGTLTQNANVSASGNTFLTSANNILIAGGTTSAAGGTINLTATTGNINQTGGQVGSGGESLTTTSVTGTTLTNADVAVLQATNSTSGDITITNNAPGGLLVSDINGLGYGAQNLGGNITIDQTAGNMTFAQILAPGNNVTLTAAGSLLAQNAFEVVIGNTGNFTAGGTIGTGSLPILANVNLLNAVSAGDMNFNNTLTTGMTLVSLTSTGGNINVGELNNGNLNVQSVTTPDTVNLSTGGSIVGASATNSIGANLLNLAAGGDIGLSSQSLTADVNTANAVTLNSVSSGGGGNIIITSNGDLVINTVVSTGDVTLTSNNGSILGITTSGPQNTVQGTTGNLNAALNIGTATTSVNTRFNTLNASANGLINILNYGVNQFTVNNVTDGGTTASSVNILNVGPGSMTVNSVTSAGSVNLFNLGGSVLAGTIPPVNVTANANSSLIAGNGTVGAPNIPFKASVTNGSLNVAASNTINNIAVDINGSVTPGNSLSLLTGSPFVTTTGEVVFNGVCEFNCPFTVNGVTTIIANPFGLPVNLFNGANVGLLNSFIEILRHTPTQVIYNPALNTIQFVTP